jgi:hypothetical protein
VKLLLSGLGASEELPAVVCSGVYICIPVLLLVITFSHILRIACQTV